MLETERRNGMDQRLNQVAKDGDIEKFYTLLAQDPCILERFDCLPFCDSPLHVAARNGKTHLALEIMTLKPSLAWKLNESELSPMHLALKNDYFKMIRGLMAIDSNLICIKGRGRITPLHYAAQTGSADLLSEFLSACPSSIDDLTIKCEKVVHIAVENHNFKAFKVLLGWLQRTNREEILNWKTTNQTKLLKIVTVNAKNFNDQTAMDIFYARQSLLSPGVSKILHSAKAKRAFELSGSSRTLAGYLSGGLSLIERQDKLLGLNSSCKGKPESYNTSDFRNSVLVVAILIVTATYQAGLSPPGGYRQDTSQPTVNSTNTTLDVTLQKPHTAGHMALPYGQSMYFYSLNGFAFLSSVWVIIRVIIGLPNWRILYLSTCLIVYAYYESLYTTFPQYNCLAAKIGWNVFSSVHFIVPMLVMLVPWIAFWRLLRQVDTFQGGLKKLS